MITILDVVGRLEESFADRTTGDEKLHAMLTRDGRLITLVNFPLRIVTRLGTIKSKMFI